MKQAIQIIGRNPRDQFCLSDSALKEAAVIVNCFSLKNKMTTGPSGKQVCSLLVLVQPRMGEEKKTSKGDCRLHSRHTASHPANSAAPKKPINTNRFLCHTHCKIIWALLQLPTAQSYTLQGFTSGFAKFRLIKKKNLTLVSIPLLLTPIRTFVPTLSALSKIPVFLQSRILQLEPPR